MAHSVPFFHQPVYFIKGSFNKSQNLTDKDMLGPNLAVALISLLYAVLFQLIVVLPKRHDTKEAEIREPCQPLVYPI